MFRFYCEGLWPETLLFAKQRLAVVANANEAHGGEQSWHERVTDGEYDRRLAEGEYVTFLSEQNTQSDAPRFRFEAMFYLGRTWHIPSQPLICSLGGSPARAREGADEREPSR